MNGQKTVVPHHSLQKAKMEFCCSSPSFLPSLGVWNRRRCAPATLISPTLSKRLHAFRPIRVDLRHPYFHVTDQELSAIICLFHVPCPRDAAGGIRPPRNKPWNRSLVRSLLLFCLAWTSTAPPARMNVSMTPRFDDCGACPLGNIMLVVLTHSRASFQN
jgi:hypothetical protein